MLYSTAYVDKYYIPVKSGIFNSPEYQTFGKCWLDRSKIDQIYTQYLDFGLHQRAINHFAKTGREFRTFYY